jgi:glycosyltransferase involved in cell wall biosynthesis
VTPEQPLLSVIAPFRNEQDNLLSLHERVEATLSPITEDYEIIFVNDGSTDRSVEVCEEIIAGDSRTRLIDLTRNFGKEMAILAGYDHARGDAVIVIDSDLQTPPELITEMVEKWQSGVEVVDAIRTSTEGRTLGRRVMGRIFYWLADRLSDAEITSDLADFRLMDKKVVEQLRACRERFRFNRGLVSWLGFRRETVSFVAQERSAGASRWTLWQLIGYAMDAVFSFSAAPLRLAGLLGLLLSMLSFLYLVFIVVENLVSGLPIPGYSTIAGGIFLLGGMNLLGIWLLGEYIGRMYEEVKGRPLYVTRRVVEHPPPPGRE